MIKYIGSKRLLAPLIAEVVRRANPTGDVIDLFSGTSRVGHALKRAGHRVLANDHNRYAATLARCYVAADAEDVLDEARRLLGEFDRLPGRAGYVTRTFCEEARYFHPDNGERIDAIRDAIADADLSPELEAVCLTSLMEAADRVDSTVGVQMAYLKQWAARAHNRLELRVPDVLPRAAGGKGEAHELDALDAAARLSARVAYLDPPYNQHKYLGNYHVWETLCRWDSPDAYGVARKRVDCRDRASDFNSRRRAGHAMRRLVDALDVGTLVVSFNDEGYFAADEMVEMLSARGEVQTIRRPFRRYVGAKIGIFNPGGERVGRVSHLDNHELLFVASPRPVDLDDLIDPPVEQPTLFA